MHERLQGDIYRCKCAQKGNYECILGNMLENEIVREEMCKRVVNEVHNFIPVLKSMHRDLVKEIRSYEHSTYLFRSEAQRLEDTQKKALFYTLMLNKICQNSLVVVEQIRQRVVKTLYEVASKQITQWKNTDKEIVELRQNLSSGQSPEKLFHSMITPIHHKYWIFVKRSFPKIRPNGSKH
jgi:hypothetical protein